MNIITEIKLDLLILKQSLSKPQIYEKSTDKFWDDEYISGQLLNIHLDLDVESASKTGKTIEEEAEFIIKATKMSKGKATLDLGCGPGLYVRKFAETGAMVTGIDLSKRSIHYAKENIQPLHSNTAFIHLNYLDMDFEESFDIVTMIYYDFCVLSVEEQKLLLRKIHKALKAGGVFILDVVTENIEMPERTNIAVSEGGLWSAMPYAEIQQNFMYDNPKTLGQQYIIIEEDGRTRIIRFYTRLFSIAAIKALLNENGFEMKNIYNNLKGEALSEDSKTYGIIALKVKESCDRKQQRQSQQENRL